MNHGTEHLNVTTVSFILYDYSLFFLHCKSWHNLIGFFFFSKNNTFTWNFYQHLLLKLGAGVQSLLGAAFATASSSSAPEPWSWCFCLFSRWRSYLLFGELLLYYILLPCSAMFCLWFVYLLTYITSIYVYYNVKRKYTKSSSLQHGG